MTYTEKELDQFLHGISLSLLSKKSAQHWRYDEETAKEIEWLEALERKVRADKADRKTEPQRNMVEDIVESFGFKAESYRQAKAKTEPQAEIKGSKRLLKGSEQTEPTSSKMEQVEPQTCSFSDCDNFKNPDYERCIECKRKQIKLKTEQTERSSE